MELQTSSGTKTINLSATIYRFNADHKCPLVVSNHGTPRSPVARRNKINMGAQSEVCRPERLIATMGDFGKGARTPTVWIYTEKDTFFPPPLPQKMFEAYKKKGGIGKLLILTSEQTAWGHDLFFRGIATWEPIVDEFLRDIHLME